MTKKKEPGVTYVLSRERAPIYSLKDGTVVIDKEAKKVLFRILGSLGGQASKGKTSPKKARASRANGKKGGRPKGTGRAAPTKD